MNFGIYSNPDGIYKTVIILKTSETPFDVLDELSDSLKEYNISGEIIIDQLLHSGNNDERFILCNFNGKEFDKSSFRFQKIKRRGMERQYMCDYLRTDIDLIDFSTLTTSQQKLIKNGFNI